MTYLQAADGRVRRRAVFDDVALEEPSESGESSGDEGAGFGGALALTAANGAAARDSDAESDEGEKTRLHTCAVCVHVKHPD